MGTFFLQLIVTIVILLGVYSISAKHFPLYVRTKHKRGRRNSSHRSIRLLFLAGMLLFGAIKPPYSVYGAEQKEELQLHAKAAVLMDADSGRVLYGKNPEEILPMASTTKIMTCIVALEYGNLEDAAQVSAYAASMPKVKLHVKQGERFIVFFDVRIPQRLCGGDCGGCGRQCGRVCGHDESESKRYRVL